MNHVKLLFFATIRDRAGVRAVELDVPADITVKDLKERISADYPTLKDSLKSVLVAIDRQYPFDEAIGPSNAERAFFPPFSVVYENLASLSNHFFTYLI